jgi:ankyrin repeat protein
MIELLLEKEADINATDKSGRTAQHGTAENGYKDVAELLFEKRVTSRRKICPV